MRNKAKKVKLNFTEEIQIRKWLMSKENISIQIDGTDSEGRGIGRDEKNRVVFIPYALPKSLIEAKIIEEKKNFAFAEIVQTIKKSPYETEAACDNFPTCGGCTWQHLEYSQQVFQKQENVKNALEKIAHLPLPSNYKFHPSESRLNYRNKMEFSFGSEKEGQKILLGLKKSKSHDIVSTDCLLSNSSTNKIVHRLEELVNWHSLPVYHSSTNSGFLRYAITRESAKTNDFLLEILTYPNNSYNQTLYSICKKLKEEFPKITGIVHSIRKNKLDIAYAEKTVARFGKEEIEEIMKINNNNLSFSYSNQSFFQVNTQMAEKLYSRLVTLAENLEIQTIADIYCGVGGIGISLAKALQKTKKDVFLYGLESMPKAVQHAKKNAEKAQINAEFSLGNAKNLSSFFKKNPEIECIILDPPRQGIDKQSMKTLLNLKKPYLILVSCKASSFARDIALLAEEYSIKHIESFDLFPQTPHVENLAILSLKKG